LPPRAAGFRRRRALAFGADSQVERSPLWPVSRSAHAWRGASERCRS